MDKWIFADVQWNAVPALEGKPLNAVEFQSALLNNRGSLEILSLAKVDKNNYFNWVSEYLYYFDIALDNRVVGKESQKRLMLVPAGAKEPKVFQINNPIGDMTFTNSVDAFYTKPDMK